MATQTASVEALLGIGPLQSPSALALAQCVEAGLPVTAVYSLASAMAPNNSRFKFQLVPKATLERRRKSAKSLTTEEGDRLVRLARVFSLALEIFKQPEKARDFLQRPHPMLDGRTPLDVALATTPGADVVINVLGRAGYGGAV